MILIDEQLFGFNIANWEFFSYLYGMGLQSISLKRSNGNEYQFQVTLSEWIQLHTWLDDKRDEKFEVSYNYKLSNYS